MIEIFSPSPSSLAELESIRAEHQERLKQIHEKRPRVGDGSVPTERDTEVGAQADVDDLADFIARIQALGTKFADGNAAEGQGAERRSLQAILDFWAAELAARDTVGDFSFTAVPRLARFGEAWPPKPVPMPSSRTGLETMVDAAASAIDTVVQLPRVVQETAATITGHAGGRLTARLPAGTAPRSQSDGVARSRSRAKRPVAEPATSFVAEDDKMRGEIIRIAAIARQWRRNPLDGYLLSGDALRAADELCKRAGANNEEPAIVRDTDIADFLSASKRHAAETTQLKSKYLYAIIAALAVALIWAAWKWYDANAARIEALDARETAEQARREATKASTFAQDQATKAEQARAEAEEARAAAVRERDNAVEARRQTELALAAAELQSFNARQAQREADAARASAATSSGELRQARDEAIKAQRVLADADAERQRAVREAEAELRRAGASAVAEEFRKATAAPSQSDVLNSVIATLEPGAARDGPIGPGRDTQIAGLIDGLGDPEPAARATAVRRLASVLGDPGLRDEVFAGGVDRVASLLAAEQANPADTSRRDAALAVLSAIPEARWDASPTGRAMARAAVGLFEKHAKLSDMPLPPEAASAMQALKARIDWPVAAGYRVDFQFAGYVRAQARAVSSALQALGWRIDGEERTANAAGVNQIRYGDPKDAASAELLAADARRAGASPALRVVRVAEIRPGRLEVWISR